MRPEPPMTGRGRAAPVVLHVAPHPDDECLGAPGCLLQLADSGARVVVVACGLGRPRDHARRRAELQSAVRTAGHELMVADPPVALRSSDDLTAAHARLVPWIVGLIDDLQVDLVVAPHLGDAHPAHVMVAQVVRDAVPRARRPPVWWAWAIWAELPRPTLLVPIAEPVVARAVAALERHRGELARNDYLTMLRATGQLAAVRGVERVLGFGSGGLPDVRHAELLTELGWVDGRWRFGLARVDDGPSLPQDWGAEAAEVVGLRHASRLG